METTHVNDYRNKELRILILEDISTDAVLVERELRRAKIAFTTRVVQTRDAFLQQLKEFAPDIILSDYLMPQFDGMSALFLAKEHSSATPFIIVTGSINEETAVECMKAGAVDYVLKDRLMRLGPAVTAALEKKRIEGEKEFAEDRLARNEQRFRALIENSSDVITIINADGIVNYISPSVERVLGFNPLEIIGKHVSKYVHHDDLPQVLHILNDLVPQQNISRSFECRIRHRDGSWRSIEAVIKNLLHESGINGMVANLRDVTEKNRAVEALRESEDRYRRLVELSPDTIFIQRDGKIVYINKAGMNLLGARSLDELLGRPVLDIVHPQYRPVVEEQLRRLNKEGVQTQPLQEKLLRLDESVVDVEVAATPFMYYDEPAAQIIARDITERRKAEEQLRKSHEQLRALAARLQSIREEERTRIAREVHDELGQELTALNMDLSGLEKRILKLENLSPEASSNLHAKLDSMRSLIDHTIQTVRRIATELRPGILDDLGLTAAIEWQAQEFEMRTGIKCESAPCLEEVTLDRDRSTAAFRIFQEALTNIARHAQATHINICLQKVDSSIVLQVRDNGRGFAERENQETGSLGLLGMRERVLPFGGEVRIETTSGQGTTVTVYIPLPQRRVRSAG